MKNVRKMIGTTALTVIALAGTTFANDGVAAGDILGILGDILGFLGDILG